MDEIRLIEVKEGILSESRALAERLREKLRSTGTFMLNLMSSPGSGKTSLILWTIDALRADFRIGIIEADIASTVDSEKVAARGVKVVQLRTGGFCHLDATMVAQGLEVIGPQGLDLVIIENVGNLVCPAEFDTGANKNAMILSIPEGDDKPLKYPLMFSVCDALVLNKIDALGVFDFDFQALEQRVRVLNPGIHILKTSCKTGEGMDAWTGWLREQIRVFRQGDNRCEPH
ncbi:MAG: hydrogenase nickel incorporation protein HypB [Dehalococcoidia bacterium]|nr:hydrogenase nickel incorporation protein HypB [Dehalococcoidia bacterium]